MLFLGRCSSDSTFLETLQESHNTYFSCISEIYQWKIGVNLLDFNPCQIPKDFFLFLFFKFFNWLISHGKVWSLQRKKKTLRNIAKESWLKRAQRWKILTLLALSIFDLKPEEKDWNVPGNSAAPEKNYSHRVFNKIKILNWLSSLSLTGCQWLALTAAHN